MATLPSALMGPRLVHQLGLPGGAQTSRKDLMGTLARSVGADDLFVQEVLRLDCTKPGQAPDLVDPLVPRPMGLKVGGGGIRDVAS